MCNNDVPSCTIDRNTVLLSMSCWILLQWQFVHFAILTFHRFQLLPPIEITIRCPAARSTVPSFHSVTGGRLFQLGPRKCSLYIRHIGDLCSINNTTNSTTPHLVLKCHHMSPRQECLHPVILLPFPSGSTIFLRLDLSSKILTSLVKLSTRQFGTVGI